MALCCAICCKRRAALSIVACADMGEGVAAAPAAGMGVGVGAGVGAAGERAAPSAWSRRYIPLHTVTYRQLPLGHAGE